jgi:hypothetical protein
MREQEHSNFSDNAILNFLFSLLAILTCFAAPGYCEESQKVSICQLKKNPDVYNQKSVEVVGFVSHDFEDFSLFDPECPSRFDIWLEYGGVAASGTIYCCGGTGGRNRPKPLVVEGISISLNENDSFREFDRLVQPPFRSGKHGSIVHATMIGRFFAGRATQFPNGEKSFRGYGHMGCCSLLAIEEIRSVDAQDRPGLDYGASPDQPDLTKLGCGTERDLVSLDPYRDIMNAQEQAELGDRSWAFEDPQRVAAQSLAGILKMPQDSLTGLRKTRTADGRVLYEWKPDGKRARYMIVVSRPYWLSFYSRDPQKVAWLVVAAYESCT